MPSVTQRSIGENSRGNIHPQADACRTSSSHSSGEIVLRKRKPPQDMNSISSREWRELGAQFAMTVFGREVNLRSTLNPKWPR
jgi:hypothetical protein